jgi:hypothetical protein
MPQRLRLLRSTPFRLAVLVYLGGIALLWRYLPARPLISWDAGGPTSLVGFLPDGQTLLTGTRAPGMGYFRGPLRLWDVRSGRPVASLGTGEDTLVPKVAIAPDGTLLAWRDRSDVHLIALPGGHEMVKLPAVVPESRYGLLTFSPDGSGLIYDVGGSSAGPALAVWDVAARRERFRLEGEGPPVDFAPDGRLLVTGTPDYARWRTGADLPGEVKLWDAATGRRVATLPEHGRREHAVEPLFAPAGGVLAVLCTPRSAPESGRIELWDIASLTPLGTIDGVTNGFFLPGGTTLATREVDQRSVGILRYWDGSNGRPLGSARIADVSGYRAWYGLRVSADHRWVVIRGQYDAVADALRLRLAGMLRQPGLAHRDLRGTGQVLVYDAASGGLQADVTSEVFDDALPSPDGKHLATVGAGGIQVWEMPPVRPRGPALAWPVLPALVVWLAGRWLGRRRHVALAAPVR